MQIAIQADRVGALNFTCFRALQRIAADRHRSRDRVGAMEPLRLEGTSVQLRENQVTYPLEILAKVFDTR